MLFSFSGRIWARKQKTHAALSYTEAAAWVLLELETKCEELRLEQGDTGATAQHATTHATSRGGVNLLHQD